MRATPGKSRGDTWETQARGHEGHLRTVVDEGPGYQVVKCDCGEAETVRVNN